MTFIWFAYFFVSLLISFSFFKIFSKTFFKILFFSLSFGILTGVWFINPGESVLAPVISIFFLENTILEGNGNYRVMRPLILSISLGVIISTIMVFLKKNK